MDKGEIPSYCLTPYHLQQVGDLILVSSEQTLHLAWGVERVDPGVFGRNKVKLAREHECSVVTWAKKRFPPPPCHLRSVIRRGHQSWRAGPVLHLLQHWEEHPEVQSLHLAWVAQQSWAWTVGEQETQPCRLSAGWWCR